VADLVVYRGADGLGVGGVAGRGVIQGGGDAALYIHHEFVAEPVDFPGGDPGLDIGIDVIQHIRRQTAGDAHFLDFFGSFYADGHCLCSVSKVKRIYNRPRLGNFPGLWLPSSRDDWGIGRENNQAAPWKGRRDSLLPLPKKQSANPDAGEMGGGAGVRNTLRRGM